MAIARRSCRLAEAATPVGGTIRNIAEARRIETGRPPIDSVEPREGIPWPTAKPALGNSLADRVATWPAIELAAGDSATALRAEALATERPVELAEQTGWEAERIA